MPGPTPNQTRLRITGYLPYDVPDTSGGTGGGTVATVAALAALPTLGLVDNQLVWVEGRRRYFRWDAQSNATALDGEIVVPTGAPLQGRWISVPWTTSIENALQAAWTIDPVGGSDDNAAGPLATYGEYIRRVPVLYIAQVVTIASSLPDSDCLVHEQQIQWHQSLSATRPGLTVIGTRVLDAGHAVVSSANETGNAAPVIDLGVALTPGTLLQATSGASNGATAGVLALIAGTNYRTTPWQNPATARVVPPVAADTVAIVTLPTVNAVQIATVGSQQVFGHPYLKNLDIKDMWSGMFAIIVDCCTFGTANPVIAGTGRTYLYRGCVFSGSGAVNINSSATMLFRQCGIIRANVVQAFGQLARIELSNSVLQGATLDLGGNTGNGTGPMVLFLSSLGIFGIAGGTALKVSRESAVQVDGTLYGADPGGGATGTDVREGGHVFVKSTQTPTLTAATELILDATATANAPPPLATGVIPPAVALTTWAQWAAAPFSRNVMSYSTGASITNHV